VDLPPPPRRVFPRRRVYVPETRSSSLTLTLSDETDGSHIARTNNLIMPFDCWKLQEPPPPRPTLSPGRGSAVCFFYVTVGNRYRVASRRERSILLIRATSRPLAGGNESIISRSEHNWTRAGEGGGGGGGGGVVIVDEGGHRRERERERERVKKWHSEKNWRYSPGEGGGVI
jgi:hypothetical protein